MVTILSYVEREKQPIRKLTVSATKYRSCIENEEIERTFSTISAFVVVRVVAQYRRNRDNKRWRDSHKPILNFLSCLYSNHQKEIFIAVVVRLSLYNAMVMGMLKFDKEVKI